MRNSYRPDRILVGAITAASRRIKIKKGMSSLKLIPFYLKLLGYSAATASFKASLRLSLTFPC